MNPIQEIIIDVEARYKNQIDKLNRPNIETLLKSQSVYFSVNLSINKLIFKKILESAKVKNIKKDEILSYIEDIYSSIGNIRALHHFYNTRTGKNENLFENSFQQSLKQNLDKHNKDIDNKLNLLKYDNENFHFENIGLNIFNSKQECINYIKILPTLFSLQIKDCELILSVDEINKKIDNSIPLMNKVDYNLGQKMDIFCYGNNSTEDFLEKLNYKKQNMEQIQDSLPKDDKLYDYEDEEMKNVKTPERTNKDLLPKFNNVNLTGQYLLNW